MHTARAPVSAPPKHLVVAGFFCASWLCLHPTLTPNPLFWDLNSGPNDRHHSWRASDGFFLLFYLKILVQIPILDLPWVQPQYFLVFWLALVSLLGCVITSGYCLWFCQFCTLKPTSLRPWTFHRDLDPSSTLGSCLQQHIYVTSWSNSELRVPLLID